MLFIQVSFLENFVFLLSLFAAKGCVSVCVLACVCACVHTVGVHRFLCSSNGLWGQILSCSTWADMHTQMHIHSSTPAPPPPTPQADMHTQTHIHSSTG